VLGIDLIFKPGIEHFEAVIELINLLTHPGDYLGDNLDIIRYVDRGSEKRLVNFVNLVVFWR
jgi:hypothetical protein